MSTTESLAVKVQTVRGWLEQQSDELAKVLPKSIAPERFARIVLTSVLRNPALADCSKQSFVLAVMESAALGLEPDSSGLAYMVPFGNVCTLIVGYRGLIQLAYRNARVVQVSAEAVYDKDVFEVSLGMTPKLTHVPCFEPGGRGALRGAYAWAKVSGGGRPFVYMPREEIEEHRARSRAKNSGPWTTDYAAMAKKTAVRSLCKFIPQSPQLMSALATDDDPEQERPLPPLTPGETVEATLDAIATAGEGQHEQGE